MLGALDRQLAREVLGAGALATAAIAGVGVLLLVGQTLAQAALLPGPAGLGAVALGLVPAVLGVALPAGLLVGTVAVGRRWAEAGDGLALQAAGYGARRLLAPLLGLGLVVGLLQAGLAHGLEPWGRAAARRALDGAAGELALVAGQPVTLGGVLVHAGEAEGGRLGEVFVAAGRVVVGAARGEIEAGGALRLEGGSAAALPEADQPPGWTLRFERARLPLDPRKRRVELVERSTADLRDLIGRMRAQGRGAEAERLALYKRTSLPLAAPVLALLGLALGARGGRPGPVTAITALCWWAAVRVCDQTVGALGPLLAAALPLIGGSAALAVAWLGWRDR